MGIQGLSLTEKCSALFPQPPLSCWVLWNPIEVLLSPEDTVQIIIGFISAGDVDFLNELTLSSCPSSPFSLMLTHHPLLLLCRAPPLSPHLFLTVGLGPFFPVFVRSGEKEQTAGLILHCVLVLFQRLAVNRLWLGNALTGEAEGARVKSGEILCISVCRCGWLFVCSGMSLICRPSTCKWGPASEDSEPGKRLHQSLRQPGHKRTTSTPQNHQNTHAQN